MKRLVRNRKFQKKEVRFTKGDLRLGFTKYGLNLPITINQFYPERSRRERLTLTSGHKITKLSLFILYLLLLKT